jgi:hypothetical protein
VYGICTFSGGKPELAPELNNVVTAAVRTKLNTWLTARGYSTIPAGWTYRQIVLVVFQRVNGIFDLAKNNIED